MDNSKKSIPLKSEPPYNFVEGTRFLLLPADLPGDLTPCKGEVTGLENAGAWLAPLEETSFPAQEEVFLVEFREGEVWTHRSRILQREPSRVWVSKPSMTEREPSKLAPFTGRSDYRVQVDLPVQVRICDGRFQSHQQWPGQLFDLSRGGMSLLCPPNQPFEKGQKVDVRVVSWEYPVRIETEIIRVWKEKDKQRVALIFPEEMTLNQRELITTFILQVQRRDTVGRFLPAIDDG